MLKQFVTATLFTITIWLSRTAAADKIDDFKDGANRSGCAAIPYRGSWGSSDERGVCEDLSKSKDATCVAFSCEKREAEKVLENSEVRSREARPPLR
jgi:hypothetical protein